MRGPNRIDGFCDTLCRVWKNYPDLRFGQLISNVLGTSDIEDMWFIEDEEMLDSIVSFAIYG